MGYLIEYIVPDQAFELCIVEQAAKRPDAGAFGRHQRVDDGLDVPHGARRALGEAIRDSDSKVLLLASGALSHTFHKLRDLRKHEASDPIHIYSPEAYEYDKKVLAWFAEGNHKAVLDDFDTFKKYKPEAGFFHYLAMAGALGEEENTSVGRLYSEYENSIGTGQVHVWFDKPEGGFPRPKDLVLSRD